MTIRVVTSIPGTFPAEYAKMPCEPTDLALMDGPQPESTECEVEQALPAVKLLFYLLGGLGLFFMGIGALWFTDLYKKKNGL